MIPFANAALGKSEMADLTTARLLLRRWRDSDREPFARMNADPRVMEFMPGSLLREESNAFVARIESHFEQYGFGLFAAELRRDHAFVGFMGLSVPTFQAHFTPCVEIGWRLAADFWGQGLATEGGQEIVRCAFQELGLEVVVSFTATINSRSQHVMEKLGMTHDAAEDFDHPRLPEGHPLRRHVLYRLRRADRKRYYLGAPSAA